MLSFWAALAAHAQPATYYPCTLMVLDSTDLTSAHQTNIQSTTNYQGGPAMPYGMDRDFQNWVAWQPQNFPVYLSGYGGGSLPASFMPGQGN